MRRVRRATTPVTTMILISSLEYLAEEYPYNKREGEEYTQRMNVGNETREED